MQNEGEVVAKKFGMHSIKLIGSIVVVVAVIVLGLFMSRRVTPQKVEALNVDRLMQSVARLMVVPNETPIIATINDADVLTKEQLFYSGSKNGDKLIIFPQAQKAVIYSPGRNVIVNSGPFVVNSGTSQTQNTPTTQTPAKK